MVRNDHAETNTYIRSSAPYHLQTKKQKHNSINANKTVSTMNFQWHSNLISNLMEISWKESEQTHTHSVYEQNKKPNLSI